MNTVTEKPKKIQIDENNPSVKLCVYGTLLKGEGNWSWALKDKAKFLGEFKSDPRFTMIGKGRGFPIVYTKGQTSIYYQVFEVTDNEQLNSIHRLEGCTGIPGDSRNWYDIIPIENELGTCWMYAQHHERELSDSEIIKSGNWYERV